MNACELTAERQVSSLGLENVDKKASDWSGYISLRRYLKAISWVSVASHNRDFSGDLAEIYEPFRSITGMHITNTQNN